MVCQPSYCVVLGLKKKPPSGLAREKYHLEVPGSDFTLEELGKKIFEVTGIPCSSQKIIFKGVCGWVHVFSLSVWGCDPCMHACCFSLCMRV